MAGAVVTSDPTTAPLGGPPDPPPDPWPAPSSAPTRVRYMPALDGIRGLAVVAVLLFHGGVLTGGYLGVDAFFVLSGFLITSLLLAEIARSGSVDLRNFWARRARRLLPALGLALVGVAVYAAVFAEPTELARIRDDALATMLYAANWHTIVVGESYWDLFRAPSPLEHTWSLAIEEQFYLVWPLVVAGITWMVARRWRGGRRSDESEHATAHTHAAPAVMVVALLAAAVSAVWMLVRYEASDTDRVYLGTDTRIAAILLGAVLAGWVAWRGPVRGRAARVALEVVAIGSAIALGVAWFRLDGQSGFVYRGGLLLCGVAVVAVVAAAAHPQPGPLARVLSWRPLVAIGLISYGLYLWHWPVYVTMTPSRTGIDGDALLALRIAVSVAIAVVSYILVEKPIRYGRVHRLHLAWGAPVAALACVTAILVSTSGAQNLPAAGQQFLSTSDEAGNPALAAARSVSPTAATRLLIVGDSVGVNVGKSAAVQAAGTDTAVVAGAIPGCVLTAGVGGYQATLRDRTFVVPELHECRGRWLETARVFRPDEVDLVYGTGASFLNVQISGRWVNPCEPPYQNWYAAQLRALVADFAAAGASVVRLLRLPYPTADFLPPDARARIDCVNALHARLANESPTIELLNLATVICPDGRCRTEIDGAPMRSDGLHFDEGASADHVARWLLGQSNIAR